MIARLHHLGLSMISRPRIAAAGVSFGLAVSLTASDTGLAQNAGYRMRGSVRPARLTGTTHTPEGPEGGPFRRRVFFPDVYFGSYLVGPDGYPHDSTGATYPRETETRAAYPAFDTVPDVGPLAVFVKQLAPRTIVQLTWRDPGVGAAQVAFFLTDSARGVLSAETVRSPPFTALFHPPPRTEFAGMTVVLVDGNLVTRFVPYRRRTR